MSASTKGEGHDPTRHRARYLRRAAQAARGVRVRGGKARGGPTNRRATTARHTDALAGPTEPLSDLLAVRRLAQRLGGTDRLRTLTLYLDQIDDNTETSR